MASGGGPGLPRSDGDRTVQNRMLAFTGLTPAQLAAFDALPPLPPLPSPPPPPPPGPPGPKRDDDRVIQRAVRKFLLGN